MTSKIHPTEKKNFCKHGKKSSVYTVWKKSSMAFQGTDGFSVYNSEGQLAYRVDNYSRKNKELFLMDGVGNTLLALRPQILSIYDQWNGFKGTSQIFTMKRTSILQKREEVQIFMNPAVNSGAEFNIEGSFWKRSCKVRNESGEETALISRKKVNESSVMLSDDVFTLEIKAGIDEELVMAFIVIMDRICHKPYSPLLCSCKLEE